MILIRPCSMTTSPGITPPTSNPTIRGPAALQAACRLPGPPASRFVTLITCPPRPPRLSAPKPSAPGKATSPSATASTETTAANKKTGRECRCAHRSAAGPQPYGGCTCEFYPFPLFSRGSRQPISKPSPATTPRTGASPRCPSHHATYRGIAALSQPPRYVPGHHCALPATRHVPGHRFGSCPSLREAQVL